MIPGLPRSGSRTGRWRRVWRWLIFCACSDRFQWFCSRLWIYKDHNGQSLFESIKNCKHKSQITPLNVKHFVIHFNISTHNHVDAIQLYHAHHFIGLWLFFIIDISIKKCLALKYSYEYPWLTISYIFHIYIF